MLSEESVQPIVAVVVFAKDSGDDKDDRVGYFAPWHRAHTELEVQWLKADSPAWNGAGQARDDPVQGPRASRQPQQTTDGCHRTRDAPQPHVELLAKDAKAGHAALIPLRADLAEDLRGWLGEKIEALRSEAEAKGVPLPLKLQPQEALFAVPRNLIKSLNLDLAAAGILKTDERGRTVDLHALRHPFGTHLSKNGVAPRTAQAAMGHSSLDLTMNVYTDPSLLDVAGALKALPDLSVSGDGRADTERAAE